MPTAARRFLRVGQRKIVTFFDEVEHANGGIAVLAVLVVDVYRQECFAVVAKLAGVYAENIRDIAAAVKPGDDLCRFACRFFLELHERTVFRVRLVWKT